jgi:hypothetical protein
MPRKPDPKSKAGFVRSFPPSTPAASIVAKAKTKGLKLDVAYVYSVRTAVNAKNKKARATAPSTAKIDRTTGTATNRAPDVDAGDLVAEIERIVEAKVTAILKSTLGSHVRLKRVVNASAR